MRIVLLGTEFGMTGAGLLLYRWAVDLVRRGQTVIAVHKAGDDGPLRAAYAASGVTLAARFKVDRETVVVCNTLLAAPYVLQVSGVAPTIWWIHEGEPGVTLLLTHPDAAQAFHRAHAVIFPSATIRDRVYKSFLLGVPDQRLHIIPPGLDPLGPDEPPPEPATDRATRVICVGSIYPRKCQVDLIMAIARLADLPIECLLVGRAVDLPGEAREIVEAAPRRYALTGELPHAETLRLLARADIFSLPSASECLPIAPMEAAQRGKALILSDLPAHEGLWRHGVNCLMHAVGDVDLLAHSLRILATDAPLRARLGEAARLTVAGFGNDIFLARLNMVMAGLLRTP